MNKIVIHCSDSPHGRGDDAETIHRWHLERGWGGIGYHFVITESGEIQNGRPLYWQGAHVSGHNRGTIGICLIGRESFTDAQFASLSNLTKGLMATYKLEKKDVVGHGELDKGKTCPNFSVRKFMEGL